MKSENVHLAIPHLPVAKCRTIARRNLRRFLRLAIALGTVIVAGVSGAATLVTTADTYSNNNEASTNFGTLRVLRVQNWANNTTFANFDLSAIGSSPVDIATLTIVTESNLKSGIVEIYRVAESWSETTLTQNNRPSLDPIPVATVLVSGLAAADTVTVDITALVNDWLTNPGSEFGLALVPTNVNFWARSRESGDGMSIETSTFLATPTPTNQFPQSGAINVSPNPTLDLSCDMPNLDAAQFQISTSIDFSAPLYDSGSLESEICGHRASASLSNISTYYWRGRQRSAAASWSEWSLATEFTTGDSSAVVANLFQDGTLAYAGTRDADIRGSGSDPDVALRNWNQGGQDVLRTGRRPAGSSTDERYRTLLMFDISALSDSSAVSNAWIELTGWMHDDASHNRDVFGINKAYAINKRWGEGTGITRPPDPGEVSWLLSSSPETWASSGAAFASDTTPGSDRAATPVVTHRSRNLEGLRATLSSNHLTELVRYWIDNPAENHGLILQADDESLLQVTNFASREHADPSFRPRLVIESTETAAVPTNQAPQVSAGADRNAVTGTQLKLDGNFTDDGLPAPPGLVTATWSLISGPGSASFANNVDPQSNVVFGSSGDYVLRLSADDAELTSFDELTVSVSEPGAMQSFQATEDTYTRNNTPSSNYGSDLVVRIQKWANTSTFARFDLSSITSSTNSAQLELGVDSVLRDGTITVHKVLGDWNEMGLTELNKPQIGPAFASKVISSADNGRLISIDITSLLNALTASPGTDFGIALVTTDGNVIIGSRESGSAMQIHTSAGGPASNTPPQVEAGSDQQSLVSDVLSLSGIVTDDGLPLPPTLTFLWSQVSGPAGAAIGDPTNITTNISFTTAGIYELLLTASDGSMSASDSLFVNVLDPAVNQPPVVTAGADRTASVRVEIALTGSIADDGLPTPPGVASATWSVVSGPGNVIFGNATNTVTTASFDANGAYVLRLSADDGEFVRNDDVAVDVSEPAAAQTLAAIQDTYTQNNTPTQNYGTEASVRVQKWADITGFIRFDLAAYAAGTTVRSATLRLTVSDALKNGTFFVHRVLGDWSELALSESNRPPLGAPSVTFSFTGANAGQTLSIGVTALFGDLLADPATEFGIALSTADGNLRLTSKESGSPILLDIETGP